MTSGPLALIIADDLSGAADSAVAFARRGVPTQVTFDPTASPGGVEVVAVDTDTRRADPADAAYAVSSGVAGTPGARLVFKKIDSTLRGNIAAETEAALRATGATLAVCAPAFPGTGRTTVDGAQYAHGQRVGEVVDLFTRIPVTSVSLAAVRQGGLEDRLGLAARDGAQVVVVDAETDADLAAVARTATALHAQPLWVGSGGLAEALARTLVPDPLPVQTPTIDGPVLVVVGSGTPQAADQAAAVRRTGADEVAFPATQLLGGDLEALRPVAERVASRLAEGADVLVTIEDGHVIPHDGGRPVVATLGRALAAAAPGPAGLVVTGGETARLLTEALGATGIVLTGELQPGVVVGRLVGAVAWPIVTKAGAFGGPTALVDAVIGLRPEHEAVPRS
jgi:D-threonate/D-erythronate kinase